MKISLPINKFKFKNNKIFVNDLIVEYENVSEDTQEILESLISKGAYGTALLTLNMFYNVKSFNGAGFTHSDYLNYLGECNKLLKEKECLVEASEALSFKPLINLNGLEIMESDNYIARGKNNKLFVEDFRLNEECEGTQCSDIAEKKDQEVGSLQVPRKKKKKLIVKEGKEPFIPAEIDKYVASYNSKTGSHKHPEDFTWLYMAGNVDGMKIRGVKQTQIFSVGSGEYLGSYDDYMKEAMNVPRNHGFKGFMMCESGYYERGNYALIKEGNKIKAVRKDSLGI